jgi:hypothetical protein
MAHGVSSHPVDGKAGASVELSGEFCDLAMTHFEQKETGLSVWKVT